MRSLKSLGVRAESYGSLLSSVLMNKLPSELRLIASRKFGDAESWDYSALLKVIEEEVQARERSSARSTHEGRRPKECPTAAALFTDTPLDAREGIMLPSALMSPNQSQGSRILVPALTANLNPEATPYSPPSTSTLWTYSGKNVLLQTAQATAFNPDYPSKTCRVRIVMLAANIRTR